MKKLIAWGVLLAGLIASNSLQATDLTWTNGGGLFSDGANWDTGVAPVDGDNTRFTNDTSYTVSFDANSPYLVSSIFTGRAGVVTLDIGTFRWSLTNFSLAVSGSTTTVYLASGVLAVTNAAAIGQIRIADGSTSAGTLIVTNGTVIADSLNVGAGADTSAKLVVSGTGVVTNSALGGTFTVGGSGSSGQMIVTNGGQVFVSGETRIGNTSTSNNLVLISGSNSIWSNGNLGLRVGAGSARGNMLIVSNGARLFTANGGTFGGNGAGTAFNTGIVVGAGSALISEPSTSKNIVIGTNASGSTNNNMTVYDGGLLTCGGSLNVGNAAGAISNSFNMGGAGVVSTGSFAGLVRFDVNSEFNRVIVTNAIFSSGGVSLGGKTNTISVLAGTQWTMSGNLTTAGSLTTVGAKFTINSGIVSNGAAGVLIGQGPVSGSQLIITNGGKLYSNFGTIGASGASGASVCTAIVAGVGSVWSNTGASLLVGNGAGGSGNYLAVLDGATLFNAGTFGIGNNSANANSVQVGGVGALSIVVNSGSNNIGSSAGSFGNRLTVTNASLSCDVINVGVTAATNNLLELRSGSISVNFIRVRPTNSVLFTAGTLSVGGTTVDALANNGGAMVVGDGTSAASLELPAGGTGFHDFNAGGLVITNNATLRGNGTLMGSVTVLGTWSPGFSVGTITTSNNLTFGSSAVIAYDLGASNDLTDVNGNLTLNGSLNVTDAGGFGVGTYTLFTYTGTLSGNGLTVATTPDSGLDYAIDTNTAGQVKLDVTIPPPPTASFSGNPNSGAVPLVVTFTNASSGSITNSFWDFGDGNTTNTTATSFNHSYSGVAVYTVSLTAYGYGGSDTNTQVNYITALNPPHLVVNPGSLSYGSITIGRTNSLSFSVINTGDLPLSGTAASAAPFGVTSGGTYNNLASGQTQTVTIAFMPVSAVSSTGSVIFASDGGNSTNTVIGTGLTPGSISVTPASHDFGNLATGTAAQVTFVVTNSGGTTVSNGTATAGGPFTVVSNATFSVPGFTTTNVVVQFAPVSAGAFTNDVVFATDNGGVSTNVVVGAGGIAAVAAFSGSPTNGTAPLAVTFTNASSGSITNAFWDFGDGHTTNTMAATLDHTYSFAGTNTVSLTVFGPVGSNTQSLSDYIVATNPPPPVAAFSGSPTNGTVPLTVTFTNASSGAITNAIWDFGDGNTSNTMASTLVHIYGSAGTNTVTLTVSGLGGSNASTQSDYIVVLNPAHLVVNPGSLSFGSLTIGLSNSLSFSVVNTGDLPLSGTASSAAPFSVTVGGAYNNLASGQTQTVTVAFQPGSAGAFTGSVIFASDGGNSTNTVVGTGLTPGSISVSPASLNFGMLATGSTAQLSFVVTNSGGTTVSNGTATVLGGPFAVVSGASFSVPGFGTTNVTVQFAPVSASAFTDSVAFASDNGGGATNTVIGAGSIMPVANFTGTPTNGVVPLAVTFTDNSSGSITNRFWDFGDGITSNTVAAGVSHTYSATGTNTVSLTVFGPLGTNTQTRAGYIVALNAAHLVVNPGSLNYGSVTIGQTNSLNFSVVNTGDLPLSGTATCAAPFSVTGGASYNVAGGQTQTVTVAFAPSSAVASTGSVIFASDGGDSTNTVLGTGLTPGSISVTPSLQDFGALTTGTTAQLSFVVTNSGGTAVSNGTATALGGPFTVVAGGSFSVPGFGTSNITVRFAPVSVGAFTNSVAFGSANDGVATNTVIGTGAIVPIASFTGNTTTGGVPLAVTFTDSSSGTITNRFWDFGDGNTTNTLTTSVAHTYNAVGTNTVSLTVSGPLGADTQTRNNYIVAYNPPVANFSGSPTLGGNPFLVTFTDSSTGIITNRFWDFGDGSTSNTTSTTVLYTYNQPGTNSVTLTVFGPGGSSTTNRLDYITVTNVVVDTIPPQLDVDSPTNNQVFTNADITVSGSASDTNGIASVTINGAAASLVNTNWSNSFTLSLGTNTITVIATDNSLQANTATQVVHAIFFVPTNNIPQITSGPLVSNALLQVSSIALVAVNQSNTFLVSATDADGDPLTYQWVFGDGTSTAPSSIGTAVHAYTTNECGPYSANISISDGQDSVDSNFTVVVACAMEISKMQAKPNFAKTDMDSWSLTAGMVLPGGFTPDGKIATIDVGGAQVAFTLDDKGRGLNSQGNCKLTFNKKTSTWQLTAKLKKGDWQDTWVDYGLVDADVPKMSATVTLPVAILIGNEGFAVDKVLIYSAKAGKSGTAK